MYDMYGKIMDEISRVDCGIAGVSYSFKEKFLLPLGDLYFVCVVRDSYSFGGSVGYSYSIVNILGNNMISVLSKDTVEYKNLVQRLPDCSKLRYTSLDPFKVDKYKKELKCIVEDACSLGYLSEELEIKYSQYIDKYLSVKDKSVQDLYDYIQGLL